MNRFTIFRVSIILGVFIVNNLLAQTVEVNLSTSDSTSAFKVTNPLSENLFQIGANGSINIGGNQFGDVLYVKGKDIFYDVPNTIKNGSILLHSSTDKTDISEPKTGAFLNLNGGPIGGDITLKAGDDYGLFGSGGDVNILSGEVGGALGGMECGEINILAAGDIYDNYGGDINIIAGYGRPGGTTTIKGGDGKGSVTGDGGSLILIGGETEALGNPGGSVVIRGGDASEIGGMVTISSGQSLSNSTGYGKILLNSNSFTEGSSIDIETGNGGPDGGNLEITLGTGFNNDGLVIINGSGTVSGDWTVSSDKRLKKDIENLGTASNKILKLRPVSYEMRKEEHPERNLPEGKQIGLIAQEVEVIFPELVKTDREGYKSINYSKLSVLLIDVTKEQNKKIENLEDEVSELKKMMKVQNNLIQEVNEKLNKNDSVIKRTSM